MLPYMDDIASYWDKRPCEAWHSHCLSGTDGWSEEVTDWRYRVQPHILEFAEFHKWAGKKVLEIGCGIGTDSFQFLWAGAWLCGIDISKESIRLAEERTRRFEHRATFYQGDAEAGLPQGPFDIIYSFGVLHHTPRPEAVLQNAARCLKPDGELRIMLYAKWSWKNLFTSQQPEAQYGCPLVRWYSKLGAKRLVESCGFRVTSIRKTHIFPWRISDYIQHSYVRAFPWNVIPHKPFERFLGHHLLIKAVKV